MGLHTDMGMRSIILVSCVCAWACSHSFADRVFMTNGRSVDGVIVRETATDLVLDIGIGTTTIASNKIQSVQRSGAVGNDKIAQEWKDQYFLHKKNVPAGMEAIADELRALVDARGAAMRQSKYLSTTAGDEARLNAELEAISARSIEVNRSVSEMKPKTAKETSQYNSFVHEINRLNARRTVKYGEIDVLRKNRKAAQDQVSQYLYKLTAFETSFSERKTKLGDQLKAAETGAFLAKAEEKLNGMTAECKSFGVRTQDSAGGTKLVSATINDKLPGTFVLDTGAASVTISQQFADKLNLDLTAGKETGVVMADGRNTTATLIRLGSVQLGDARAENVEAVVLPTTGDDADGLLGMTFLRNFMIHFDGQTGQLVLREFAPK